MKRLITAMMFSEVSSMLEDSWEEAKKSWKDSQAVEYENNCIEPTRETLIAMHSAQQSIIQTIEEFDQKIKKYE